MATDSTASKPRRRRPAFVLTVRGLIALVLLTGGGLGWLAYKARVQREAVAILERAGARVIYDFQLLYPRVKTPWWKTKWLIDAVGVDSLASVDTIEDGVMSNGLTDADLAAVGRLSDLETLCLWSSPALTDAGLAHLRGNTRLNSLEVNNRSNRMRFTGASLAHLKGLTQLEHLAFITPQIVDADLAHLSSLVRLRRLELSLGATSEVTDAGLASLEPLRELRHLQIDGARKVTNQGLAHLGKLTNLETLSFMNASVTDLSGLGPLSRLKNLGISAPIDDAGLAPVVQLPCLASVFLTNARITDAGVAHLLKLPALAWVSLGSAKISDVGAARLAESPTLGRVGLFSTNVGDPGVAALAKMKRLSVLDLSGNKNSAQAIKAASAAHPALSIFTDEDNPGTGASVP